MQVARFAKTRGIHALLLVAALSGCVLPRSGPSLGQIRRAADVPGYDMHLVDVTPTVAAASRSVETLGFGADFVGAAAVSPDTIRAGDKLSVRVWENVDTGLLVGTGLKSTALEAVEVDQSGEIFVPYAGRIEAAGSTPDELRLRITDVLKAQTPDPQIEVFRAAGDGSTVSVMGGVRAPGVYPIEAPTLRLSSMLAKAGGVAIVPDVAQVKLERRGATGRVWLQDLYDSPRMDVALRPGDRVIVEEDRRSFTVLGATVKQQTVPFNSQDMSVIEAIAASGGLNGNAANPTGVFVFRRESSDVANRVLGRSDLVGEQRMAYLLDFTRPEGLFAAGDFVIRDNDTIYVTEAALGSWTRIIALAATAAALTRSVDVLTQ
jgi:polysaccharide export outer membrane protein